MRRRVRPRWPAGRFRNDASGLYIYRCHACGRADRDYQYEPDAIDVAVVSSIYCTRVGESCLVDVGWAHSAFVEPWRAGIDVAYCRAVGWARSVAAVALA